MVDREKNRFSARAARYARVGTNMGGVAAKFAASRLFGFGLDRGKNASDLAAALGGLKGPIMKVRSEEHTSEPSHVAISYAVFCLKKKRDRAARLDRSRAADRAGQLDVARLARRRRRRERQAAAGLECDRRDHA